MFRLRNNLCFKSSHKPWENRSSSDPLHASTSFAAAVARSHLSAVSYLLPFPAHTQQTATARELSTPAEPRRSCCPLCFSIVHAVEPRHATVPITAAHSSVKSPANNPPPPQFRWPSKGVAEVPQANHSGSAHPRPTSRPGRRCPIISHPKLERLTLRCHALAPRPRGQ